MKHPGPWKQGALGFIRDANGKAVCSMKTLDHETRAILTHAAEMYAAMQRFVEAPINTQQGRDADKALCILYGKIEAEILAARKADKP